MLLVSVLPGQVSFCCQLHSILLRHSDHSELQLRSFLLVGYSYFSRGRLPSGAPFHHITGTQDCLPITVIRTVLPAILPLYGISWYSLSVHIILSVIDPVFRVIPSSYVCIILHYYLGSQFRHVVLRWFTFHVKWIPVYPKTDSSLVDSLTVYFTASTSDCPVAILIYQAL